MSSVKMSETAPKMCGDFCLELSKSSAPPRPTNSLLCYALMMIFDDEKKTKKKKTKKKYTKNKTKKNKQKISRTKVLASPRRLGETVLLIFFCCFCYISRCMSPTSLGINRSWLTRKKKNKHNAELRGTAPGANIPKFL